MSHQDTPGKAPAPRRQAVGKRASGPRRLLRLTSAFLRDAGLGTPTEAQKGLARAAAGATCQLERMDEAQTGGAEVDPLAYARLAGVARRNLRALGLVEDRSSSSGNGAAPQGGASSTRKKVAQDLPSMRDQIYAFQCMTLEEKLDHVGAHTPEDRKMWTDVWAWADAWSARYEENKERKAKGLKPLPEIEKPRRTDNNSDTKKRFHAQGDRPRRTE